jgi:hypothetical protein
MTSSFYFDRGVKEHIMKKLHAVFAIVLVVVMASCSSSGMNESPTGENDRSMSFNGAAPIAIDTLQGQFVGNYEVGSTIFMDFVATNYTTGQSIFITLYDEDESSSPFLTNSTFSIGSGQIRSAARYREFDGLDIQASFGSVTLNEYMRVDKSDGIYYEVSGTFTFSDGTENMTGTFDNLRLFCLECE